ncbi:N-alpha-acetyltransferase 40-like [Actinia tenebrosa]|uniref:N-alpha-acetyltransferase 40 n=1 Tax=Actinia tenebrosa TaxID=6105 RepID=A0A6P8JAS6_ACTTE|nr:N-alpha-acetyltransferase 40-like [Actinia tenebrosa]
MGRKSLKGKEKKLRRKEEVAKINASQAAVDAANEVEDPIQPLAAFKKYNRNGLDLEVTCRRVTAMNPEEVQWVFDLTKRNMEALYEESDWGWNDKKKMDEMTEEKAWYLLVNDKEGNRVALSHFRFDLDENMDEVLYCYEVQVDPALHHKGLGKFLMQILELIGHKAQMKKVVLTVFTDNSVAINFFKNCLKYQVDETSPSLWDPAEEYCYEILSKPLIRKTTDKPKTEAS